MYNLTKLNAHENKKIKHKRHITCVNDELCIFSKANLNPTRQSVAHIYFSESGTSYLGKMEREIFGSVSTFLKCSEITVRPIFLFSFAYLLNHL